VKYAEMNGAINGARPRAERQDMGGSLLGVKYRQYLVATFKDFAGCCESLAPGQSNPFIEKLFNTTWSTDIISLSVNRFFPVLSREPVVAND
jgi:hypothetical protein